MSADQPRKDSWSEIDGPERVAAAVRKMETLGRTRGEVEARRRYLGLLDPRPGERIVDVGAGTGLISLEIAAKVAPHGQVVAIDPAAALLEHARAAAAAAGLASATDFRVGDGKALDFPDGSFDAAFSHWVLLHVDPPEGVLRELKRVTRPGGRVMCVEMDWETAIVHPGEKALTRRILNHSADRHIDGWIGRRLRSAFLDCGLVDVGVEAIVDWDDGSGVDAWFDFVCERADNARQAGVIDGREAANWLRSIEHGLAARQFFFAVTQFAMLGRVPASSAPA